MTDPASENRLIERLGQVLHDLGLPCACQDEVERTLAVFADFEARRSRIRLLREARERADRLSAFLPFLDDLAEEDAAALDPGALTGLADAFREIAAVAAEGAAALDMLAAVHPADTAGGGLRR